MSIAVKIAQRLSQMTDPRWRNFYLQRTVTDIDKRNRYADRVASRLPRPDSVPAEAKAAIEALDRQGYAMLPSVVTPEVAADLRAYFETKTCSDPYHPERGHFTPPKTYPEGVHVAYFDALDIATAPHILNVVNNPVVLAAASSLLGAKATIGYISVWWSLPAGDGTAQQAENFHRDVDDWRFCKLFSYLTDVDDESGPHIFIPGSHKQNKLTPIRRYSEEEIAAAFGDGNEKTFVGSAGTSFMENTYGFHRGLPARSRPRLALAATYSLRPVPYGPKQPVAQIGQGVASANLDPYVNRIYCRAA